MGAKRSALCTTTVQSKRERRAFSLEMCISTALSEKVVTSLTVGEGLQQLVCKRRQNSCKAIPGHGVLWHSDCRVCKNVT